MTGDDATELGELLDFLRDWLASADQPLLATSLHRFVGSNSYQLDDLRTDLARMSFLLGHDDGASLFGHDQH